MARIVFRKGLEEQADEVAAEVERQLGPAWHSYLEQVLPRLQDRFRPLPERRTPDTQVPDRTLPDGRVIPGKTVPGKHYPGQSIRQQIEPILRNAGVSPEELQWTGLLDWLDWKSDWANNRERAADEYQRLRPLLQPYLIPGSPEDEMSRDFWEWSQGGSGAPVREQRRPSKDIDWGLYGQIVRTGTPEEIEQFSREQGMADVSGWTDAERAVTGVPPRFDPRQFIEWARTKVPGSFPDPEVTRDEMARFLKENPFQPQEAWLGGPKPTPPAVTWEPNTGPTEMMKEIEQRTQREIANRVVAYYEWAKKHGFTDEQASAWLATPPEQRDTELNWIKTQHGDRIGEEARLHINGLWRNQQTYEDAQQALANQGEPRSFAGRVPGMQYPFIVEPSSETTWQLSHPMYSGGYGQDYATPEEAQQAAQRWMEEMPVLWGGQWKPGKWDNYAEHGKPLQLPGGENYGEYLLQLPQSARAQGDARQKLWGLQQKLWKVEAEIGQLDPEVNSEEQYAQYLAEGERGPLGRKITRYTDLQQERAQLKAKLSRLSDYGAGNFRSGHWDEPNVLAHTRFQEFPVGDAERALVVDEFQSDWHKEGRDQGYQGDVARKVQEAEDALEAYQKELDQKYNGDWLTNATDEEQRRIDQLGAAVEIAQSNAQWGHDAVPDAPWRNNWHEPMLRRMARYAAERDMDYLAWTPAEVQQDRYNLAHWVDEIGYDARNHTLTAYPKGGGMPIRQTVPPEKLKDHIGKEVAERLLASPTHALQPETIAALHSGDYDWDLDPGGLMQSGSYNREFTHTLEFGEGEEPRLGGESKANLYDRALVNYANRWGKPFGQQVQPIQVYTSRDHHYEFPEHENEQVRGARFARLEVGGTPQHGYGVRGFTPDEQRITLGTFPSQGEAQSHLAQLQSQARKTPAGPAQQLHAIRLTPEWKQKLLAEGVPRFKSVDEDASQVLFKADVSRYQPPDPATRLALLQMGGGGYSGYQEENDPRVTPLQVLGLAQYWHPHPQDPNLSPYRLWAKDDQDQPVQREFWGNPFDVDRYVSQAKVPLQRPSQDTQQGAVWQQGGYKLAQPEAGQFNVADSVARFEGRATGLTPPPAPAPRPRIAFPRNRTLPLAGPVQRNLAAAGHNFNPYGKSCVVFKAYKLQGEVNFQGLDVAIENREGSIRRGRGWETKMYAPYGYLRDTLGVDGDPIDVYVGPNKDAPTVFVIHQHAIGKVAAWPGKTCPRCHQKPADCWHDLDEDKVMLGYLSKEAAIHAYNRQYDDWRFLGPVTELTMAQFRRKIETSKKHPRLIKALGNQGWWLDPDGNEHPVETYHSDWLKRNPQVLDQHLPGYAGHALEDDFGTASGWVAIRSGMNPFTKQQEPIYRVPTLHPRAWGAAMKHAEQRGFQNPRVVAFDQHSALDFKPQPGEHWGRQWRAAQQQQRLGLGKSVKADREDCAQCGAMHEHDSYADRCNRCGASGSYRDRLQKGFDPPPEGKWQPRFPNQSPHAYVPPYRRTTAQFLGTKLPEGAQSLHPGDVPRFREESRSLAQMLGKTPDPRERWDQMARFTDGQTLNRPDLDPLGEVERLFTEPPAKDRHSFEAWQRLQDGQPFDVFRATNAEDLIHPGAYVTTNRSWAEDHLHRRLQGKGHVLRRQVTPEDLYPAPSGDPGDFIYAPDPEAWHRETVGRAYLGGYPVPLRVLEDLEGMDKSLAGEWVPWDLMKGAVQPVTQEQLQGFLQALVERFQEADPRTLGIEPYAGWLLPDGRVTGPMRSGVTTGAVHHAQVAQQLLPRYGIDPRAYGNPVLTAQALGFQRLLVDPSDRRGNPYLGVNLASQGVTPEQVRTIQRLSRANPSHDLYWEITDLATKLPQSQGRDLRGFLEHPLIREVRVAPPVRTEAHPARF